jgi:hypothetical protein
VATYVPVLKGKPGEFRAWREANAAVVAASRVVFEVVPKRGAERDLTDFVRGIAKGTAPGWRAAAIATVDTGYIDQTEQIDGTRVLIWTAQQLLKEKVRSRPVMRLDDPPNVLADIAVAVALSGTGVCLRLGSSENDPSADVASALAPQVLKAVDLKTTDVDLLIDMWTVMSQRDVERAAPVALEALAWAAANGPWRTVTLLSGAFPDSISTLPKGTATPITRYDAELYNQVIATNPPVVPDFGDYGPASPAMPSDVPRGPLPNLRYAAQTEWQVYREAKKLPGNESFFTLCGRVAKSNHWSGAGYSWGDREIERCARSTGGAGRATEWRAYGTSHHLAHVIDRLTTNGVP